MPWFRRGDGVVWHVEGALTERLRREGYEEVVDPTAPPHEEVQGAPANDGDAHQQSAADDRGPGRRKPGV